MNLDERIRSALEDFDAAVRAEVETPPLGRRRRRVAPLVAVAASVVVITVGVGWLNRPAPLPPAATQVGPTTTTTTPVVLNLPALVAPVDHEEYAARVEFIDGLLAPTRDALAACLQEPAPEIHFLHYTDPLLAVHPDDPIQRALLFPDADRMAASGLDLSTPERDGGSLGPCEAILTRSSPDVAAVQHLNELWWAWFDSVLMTQTSDAVDPALEAETQACFQVNDFDHEFDLLNIVRESGAPEEWERVNRRVGEILVECAQRAFAAEEARRRDARPVFLAEHTEQIERVGELIGAALRAQRSP